MPGPEQEGPRPQRARIPPPAETGGNPEQEPRDYVHAAYFANEHADVQTIGRRCGMSSPTTVAEISAGIAAAHQRFAETLALLSDAQL